MFLRNWQVDFKLHMEMQRSEIVKQGQERRTKVEGFYYLTSRLIIKLQYSGYPDVVIKVDSASLGWNGGHRN